MANGHTMERQKGVAAGLDMCAKTGQQHKKRQEIVYTDQNPFGGLGGK